MEYIDAMSLCRAIELIGFLNRGRKGRASRQEYEDEHEHEPHELTQIEKDRQFAFLQSAMGGASALPPDLKDAIRWAEEQKAKHHMN